MNRDFKRFLGHNESQMVHSLLFQPENVYQYVLRLYYLKLFSSYIFIFVLLGLIKLHIVKSIWERNSHNRKSFLHNKSIKFEKLLK